LLDKINRGETIVMVRATISLHFVVYAVISLLPSGLGTSFTLCQDSQIFGAGRSQTGGLVGVCGETDRIAALPVRAYITGHVYTGSILASSGTQCSGAP